MNDRLSTQQDDAIRYLRRVGKADREGFYRAGIRMPTVRSLVRRGLVRSETRVIGSCGRTMRLYSCNTVQPVPSPEGDDA